MRFWFVVILIVSCCAASLLHAADSKVVQRPNVIVILTDDQGLADYSACGTKDIRTPAIDRLAQEGITFDHFRASCCVCSPTRAALLTGCYPDRVGVPGVIRHTPENSWGWLAPDAALLPQILKSAGYHSAIIGKWHLGLESPNTPTERGFDFFHGFLGDMMDDYYTHLRGGQNFMRRDREVINPTGHATDLFAEWACQYLTERKQINQQHAQQVPQPFFLYLAFNAPHDPIQPPQEWVDRVVRREPGITTARAKLVALIEHMDAGIGRVLDTLDRLQMSNQTLVFFTSDNGGLLGKGANNGPWRSEKQHMYEGGLRVPAIARWPGQFPPGQRTSLAATTMDLFPTIADAAKVTSPSTIDGLSFLSAIAAIPDPSTVQQFQNRELYFVRREGGAAYGGKTIEAMIRGNWKLIQDSPFQPLELYNLAIDPIESENLVSTEKEQFQTLSAALRKRIQDGGKTAWQPPSNKE